MDDLRSLRKNRGMSQQELAIQVGVSQRCIANYELRKRTPSPEIGEKIASVFDLSIEEMWQMLYANKPTDVA